MWNPTPETFRICHYHSHGCSPEYIARKIIEQLEYTGEEANLEKVTRRVSTFIKDNLAPSYTLEDPILVDTENTKEFCCEDCRKRALFPECLCAKIIGGVKVCESWTMPERNN
jgi:hypothetical protein